MHGWGDASAEPSTPEQLAADIAGWVCVDGQGRAAEQAALTSALAAFAEAIAARMRT